MADLIDRRAAIDAITDERIVANMDSVIDTELHRCKRATQRILANLPSAQPERKTGRWEEMPDPYGFFDSIPVCSECGCTTTMRTKSLFCPHCGARMEVK